MSRAEMKLTAPSMGLLMLALGLVTGGCKPECEQNLHCAVGEICDGGQCVARACGDSAECPIESFCSDDSGSCAEGCQSDRDCYPYQACDDDGQCVGASCRSTVLDCSMGEFCDPITGECFQATGAYCRECDDENDCGTGNMCLSIGAPTGQTYCGVDCSSGQECPRGYSCGDVQDISGNIVGNQCITACWAL